MHLHSSSIILIPSFYPVPSQRSDYSIPSKTRYAPGHIRWGTSFLSAGPIRRTHPRRKYTQYVPYVSCTLTLLDFLKLAAAAATPIPLLPSSLLCLLHIYQTLLGVLRFRVCFLHFMHILHCPASTSAVTWVSGFLARHHYASPSCRATELLWLAMPLIAISYDDIASQRQIVNSRLSPSAPLKPIACSLKRQWRNNPEGRCLGITQTTWKSSSLELLLAPT